jgi:hypothetical protein
MLTKSFTLSLAWAVIATAQSSIFPSFTTSSAPAAETVALDSNDANVPLFAVEAVQLTDNVITAIQNNPDLAQYASLFEFEDSLDSAVSARMRRVRKSLRCKTMPGDLIYPQKAVLGLFDLLLGGALEKIVPIGSPCYQNSEYNNYNAEQCASLVRDYNKEEI